MKNILNFKAIGFLALLLMFSCNSDDAEVISTSNIGGLDDSANLVVGGSKTYELSGGDGTFSVKVADSNIVKATISGKTLTIEAKAKGATEVSVTSALKSKVMKVTVLDNTVGVYKNNELRLSVMATVKNQEGIWLLEKANPYSGKRLFISSLPENLQVGQSLPVNVKSVNLGDVIATGEGKSATVDVISDDFVALKIDTVLVIVPKK